jgi:hypothetical protein
VIVIGEAVSAYSQLGLGSARSARRAPVEERDRLVSSHVAEGRLQVHLHVPGQDRDGVHEQQPVPHTVQYAVGDNRVDIVRDDGATNTLWSATKNEWFGLIDVAGLELALYGGFAREPFADDSDECVFVTRRISDQGHLKPG